VKYADYSPLLTDSPDRGGGGNRAHTLTLIHSVSQNVIHIIVSCESRILFTLKAFIFRLFLLPVIWVLQAWFFDWWWGQNKFSTIYYLAGK